MDESSEESSIEIHQIGSSTPMNSSFLSPIKKFDNLNLNNLSGINEDEIDGGTNEEIIIGDEILGDLKQEISLQPNHETVGESEEYEIGDQTIEHSTDEEDILSTKPIFINKRKRENMSDIEMITPTSNNRTESNNNSNNKMSICSNINVTSTSLSNFKLSFSNSDSTPCPPPVKKKFKLKHDQTPINKKKLLNFLNSIKTKVNELPDYHHEDNSNHEHEYSYNSDGSSSPIEILKNANQQSTPISQSTPSNSRVTSPIRESQGSINGYRLINREFITPTDEEQDNIEEPDISEDFDIGNNRIGDPYLQEPETLKDNMEIRTNYMTNKYKLPLLDEIPETKSEIIQKLTTGNILEFYKFIKSKDESLFDLLRRERIKWHPDRWINEKLDLEIINCISKTINSIIETYDL